MKYNGKIWIFRASLTWNSPNVVYIIFCKTCGDRYVGSTDFKARFRIHKSEIKISK